MNCISPPELSDKQLLAYLDGDIDNDIKSHLKQCSYCRDRASQFAREQNRLVHGLYRLTCPSSLELGEYHLHMLPAPQTLKITQHLRECPYCPLEIEQLEGYLSESTSWTNPLKQIRILVAQLVGGEGYGGVPSVPSFAELRGDGDEPIIFEADNVRIVIEVEEDVEQMGSKTLLGLVTGLESNEFTIQVIQQDQEIATTSVDEIGNFIISHLKPDHYKLILSGPNIEIHIPSLAVI